MFRDMIEIVLVKLTLRMSNDRRNNHEGAVAIIDCTRSRRIPHLSARAASSGQGFSCLRILLSRACYLVVECPVRWR